MLGKLWVAQDKKKRMRTWELKSKKLSFSILGPAFSFKYLFGPLVKLHIYNYRKYLCTVLRSGLSSLNSLSIFQRKTLKGVLKLSNQATTSALHFLTGELPIEAQIHQDVFSLFYSMWSNPDSKIFKIVKQLLKSSTENSRTWSNFVRQLSKQYGLEDPLNSMEKYSPNKSHYKTNILIRIRPFHEYEII